MTKPSIIVIGSSNTDMVIKSSSLPVPGETILGGDFLMNPGGKGANQAVAAARLGGEITLVAKVGNDIFGQAALEGFRQHGIKTDHVAVDAKHPSGVALIMVDDEGENCISVALGANLAISTSDIDRAREAIAGATMVLLQLEIPMPIVEYVVDLCAGLNVPVVLNPAPAAHLSDQVLKHTHILTPNETETEILTGIKVEGIDSARKAAQALRKKGVKQVIITLGKLGAYVLNDTLDELVLGISVEAVDTTAAGDTFNGALVVALSEGQTMSNAIAFANRAAAFSVTKMGAQSSAPSRDDLAHL